MNSTRSNKSVHDHLRSLRLEPINLINQRLKRGIAEGDVPKGVDVGNITSFYVTMLHGLAIRARDGATRKAMMAAVDAAMFAWNELVSPRRPSARKT